MKLQFSIRFLFVAMLLAAAFMAGRQSKDWKWSGVARSDREAAQAEIVKAAASAVGLVVSAASSASTSSANWNA